MHSLLCRAFRSATDDERLGVLNAHPDLAGKLAAAGHLTAESTAEQAGAGLDMLTDDERAASQVVADTFLRFKGLERPFVIVAEVAKGRTTEFGTRMHIALTRGTVGVTLICGVGVLG